MIFKLVLKGFKLKKVECWAKKWFSRFNRSTGCVHSVEDRLREAKKFLSLPVAFSSRSRLNLNRLRSGRGPIKVRLRPNGHLPSIKCLTGDRWPQLNLDQEEKATRREKLFGLPRSVLDWTSTTGRSVPHPVEPVEPFFGSTPNIFQLKTF